MLCRLFAICCGAQRPGCRGGSRYVEGCRGFPYLKKCIGFLVSWLLASWFIGFLVCWFLGFLVSWFLGFRGSWFLGFKIQKSFNVSKDILSILPNVHFMFFDRYWSHIQHLQDFIKRIFIIFWCQSFPKLTRKDFQNCEIYKKICFKRPTDCSRLFLGVLVSPKIKLIDFGAQGHVPKPRNHRNEGLGVLP